MPNNGYNTEVDRTLSDRMVQDYLKQNPDQKGFFMSNPIPQSAPIYNTFLGALREENPQYKKSYYDILKDKAELNYYSGIINQNLMKKYPQEYAALQSTYGWNPKTRLSPTTRVKGADTFAKDNPAFYLTPEEQQEVLGEKFNRYVQLRGQYGKELNLLGEGDNPEMPQSWKAGARHSVAFNPISYRLMGQGTNIDQDVIDMEMEYNPETGYRSYLNLDDINTTTPEQSRKNVYMRKLNKVVTRSDLRNQVERNGKIYFQTPGTRYYKVYDDGTEEEITPDAYKSMQGFNELPQYIKDKYVYEVDPETVSPEEQQIVNRKFISDL